MAVVIPVSEMEMNKKHDWESSRLNTESVSSDAARGTVIHQLLIYTSFNLRRYQWEEKINCMGKKRRPM